MSTIDPRISLARRLRRWLATSEGRRCGRALWHILVAIAIFAVVAVLENKGNGLRHAAMLGDPEARRLRAKVVKALGHGDALSVLEHAMTGFGAALLGIVVLQLFYVKLVTENGRPIEPLGRAGWVGALMVAGTVGFGAGKVMYPGTEVLVGALVAIVVLAVFAFPHQWRHLAEYAPQWIIGLAGGVMWVAGDVAWKIHHAPVTHDPPEIVAAHLMGGVVTLVVTSWALGKLIRRTRWLSPTPTRGR
ncbi:hypothetical protein WI40_14725 [Burkholderia ubonensis]|uniref:hypothetical protein n=1 Tax=Burkholderia ubonensis TaxID=101571 RepID=UPI00075795DF|nr:hypothetical protein [Burkholderia ubonensis]KUZ97528.1 hypothetical protein WI40_14725 [Burkholderia ubonensis]